MLSKTSIVIIGLLCKEELSAYDMLKKIDAMSMKYWFPIGNTTLYETALRLEKKGFIEGTGHDAKCIYRITQKGRDELRDTIRKLFLQIDYDTVWFCLAVIYCRVIENDELGGLIKARRQLLLEYLGGTTQKLSDEKENHIPYCALCAIDRMAGVIRLELDTLDKLESEQLFTSR